MTSILFGDDGDIWIGAWIIIRKHASTLYVLGLISNLVILGQTTLVVAGVINILAPTS